MDNQQLFEKNGYLLIKNFLNKEYCKSFVEKFELLIQEGKASPDIQCPNAPSVYGASFFEELLENLRPFFEKECGKKLHPTYSYARLYRPGDVLEPHTDRPSCEISATITLDIDGQAWPIYFSDLDGKNVSKIKMNVGDAVLYRGMDKKHWRDEYKEGTQQLQVFLHYVDQNGPHSDFKYDQRESLGIEKITKVINNNVWSYDDILDEKACDMLVSLYSNKNLEREKPFVGRDKDFGINLSIRNTERIILPTYKGIAARLVAAGIDANIQNWKFDITHSNQSEFLIYDQDGHYSPHIDWFFDDSQSVVRKLTVLAFLNDDFEGGKFFVQLSGTKFYPKQTKGTVIVFPSFLLHGVEPVTKGIRYSTVAWMVGPNFR